MHGLSLSQGMTKISVICADSNHLVGTLASGWAGERPCPPTPPCTCWFDRGGQLTESCGTALGTHTAGSVPLLCTWCGSIMLCWAGKPGWGDGYKLFFLPPCKSMAWLLFWAGIQPSSPCLSRWQLEPTWFPFEEEVGWHFWK